VQRDFCRVAVLAVMAAAAAPYPVEISPALASDRDEIAAQLRTSTR